MRGNIEASDFIYNAKTAGKANHVQQGLIRTDLFHRFAFRFFYLSAFYRVGFRSKIILGGRKMEADKGLGRGIVKVWALGIVIIIMILLSAVLGSMFGSSVDYFKGHLESDAKAAISEEAPPVGIVPIGTVTAFAGPIDKLPNGWLPCDGRQLHINEYKDLFAAIGWSWGGDEKQGVFNIPDLRGRFLRGVDEGTGRDPDADSRTHQISGVVIGGVVGSVQEDMLQSHKHVDSGHVHTGRTNTDGGHSHPVDVGMDSVTGTNGTYDGDGGTQKRNNDLGYSISVSIPDNTGRHSHSFTTASSSASLGDPVESSGGQIRCGKETRVKNSYVYWIIRAR
jgi:microcystin-dependent protein